MKTVTKTYTLYTFDELSDTAKDKARQWYLSISYVDMNNAWEQIRDDAKEIGLEIISLDTHKANKGRFIISAIECSEAILRNHGDSCGTYKTARKFQDAIEALPELPSEDDDSYDKIEQENCEATDALEEEFLQSLLEDYRIMLDKEIEYCQSNEYVDETIRSNEYTFNENGNRPCILA